MKNRERDREGKEKKRKKDEKLNSSKCETGKAPTVKVVIEFMKKTTVPLQSRVRFVTASVNWLMLDKVQLSYTICCII